MQIEIITICILNGIKCQKESQPSYIFADEPTGNLDEKNAELVFRIIKKFNVEHHATVVFVTHDKKFINFTKNTLDLTVLDKQEKILTH